MVAALLLCYFVVCALGAIVALALIDFRTVPPVAGTCAVIVTLAALAVAILH